MRTIVAEDIADHFGERYRTFPHGVKQDGLEIRRDRLSKKCVLEARTEDRVAAASKTRYVRLSFASVPSESCVFDEAIFWLVGLRAGAMPSPSSLVPTVSFLELDLYLFKKRKRSLN